MTDERSRVLRDFVTGSRVLDVGCARGHYVDHLANLGFNAIGVDFVPGFLMDAAAGRRRGAFVLADAHHVPFAAKSFDTVLMFDVLEHMADEDAVLQELVRVARRRILLIVPRTTEPQLERHGLVFRHHLDRTHERTYAADQLSRLIEYADIRVEMLDRVSVKHAMLSLIRSRVVRLLIRAVLRPIDVSTHSEYLVVIDLPPRSEGSTSEELAA